MSKTLAAVFENGVFRPLEAVHLPEHQRVTVTIPEDEASSSRSEAGGIPTADDGDGPRPWRGVFAPALPHEELFSQTMNVSTRDLPSWHPHVTLSQRWVADDES